MMKNGDSIVFQEAAMVMDDVGFDFVFPGTCAVFVCADGKTATVKMPSGKVFYDVPCSSFAPEKQVA